MIHIKGPDFMLCAEDLDDEQLQDLLDCTGPGDATDAVRYAIRVHGITGDPNDCREILREYGVWSEDELKDHAENLVRCVWILACDLAESEDGIGYLSTY